MKIIEIDYEWRSRLSKRSKTDMIVLHHADVQSCTAHQIHQWHLNNGWEGIGYHFFVRRNGQIYRGRPEDTIGSHAVNYNSKSIGICFEGDYMIQTMTNAQLEAGKELVAYLKDKYKITKVKGHRDLMATSCPGDKFPFDEIAGANQVPNVNTSSENLVLSFQKAAIADGVKLPKYGADGSYGSETAQAMQKCVVKRRITYQYKNCTKLVQRLLGFTGADIDGKCGPQTAQKITEFQQKNKLVADGCCGLKTWQKLLGIN